MNTIVLDLKTVGLTEEQFYRLCQINQKNQIVEIVNLPATLLGEEVLPDFSLELPVMI
ncbi:hypothetical protein [Gloeocapsa sp. PCC 73106]|uniref:hypothetical protein n=1 Tax=Gloeocapsa sp. PCC 73106 TaxID=102232 RepID=UPI0002ABF317|nr:hypothetical protein [Gloeocapsa sp. PCC 73106]ELR98215.1 hypothetical protein GLO73106DRAFT_00020420 [Gloeocapsa sp. PCC 73106]